MTQVDGRRARVSRSDGTRRKLLRTAERLFGSQGIESVSLRQIAAEARQGNHHAVQYHFGSKAALIDELLEWRRQPVNEQRSEMLDVIAASTLSPEALVRAAVEAIVLPLAQYLDVPRSHFLRFNYHWATDFGLFTRGSTTPYRVVGREPSAHTGVEAVNLVVDALSDMDSRTVELRVALMLTLQFGALAERERLEQSESELIARDLFLRELIDSMVAILRR